MLGSVAQAYNSSDYEGRDLENPDLKPDQAKYSFN
jgi:hypothetical protein